MLSESEDKNSDLMQKNRDNYVEHFNGTNHNQIQCTQVSKLFLKSDIYVLFQDEEMHRQEFCDFKNSEQEKNYSTSGREFKKSTTPRDEISTDPGEARSSHICMNYSDIFSTHDFPII